MKYFVLFVLAFSFVRADDYYFPPINSDEWATKSLAELGWDSAQVEPLYHFLDTTETNGFIVLANGKKVLEKYFGNFDKDSYWYWASAGKSLAATLIGLAQQEGKLNIADATSDYLGEGWTSMELEKERKIKLVHQLTMSTGMDFNVQDLDCLEPDCLKYLYDPGTHWYYHNAVYRLLLDVLESAYGKSINDISNELLGDKIGMGGFWSNYVRKGKTSDLARFGLFIVAGGRWGESFRLDPNYYNAMVNTSQEMNKSYGYLWWLNGKDKYKLPGLDMVFNGPLVPTAPLDMFAALGKNDQKIYVVPSMKMVVVRVGSDAGDGNFALSSYDTKLWRELSKLFAKSEVPLEYQSALISPNPASSRIRVSDELQYETAVVYDMLGNKVQAYKKSVEFDISDMSAGTYELVLLDRAGKVLLSKMFIKAER
jgi:CubicO group peptidase (beta-lactamase class C family)